MLMKLKHLVLSALAAVGLAFTSQAEVYKPTGNSWTCDSGAKTLTEDATEGTPWVLTATVSSKNLTITGVNTVGTSTVLDFTTISGGNVVTTFNASSFKGKKTIQYVNAPDATTFKGGSGTGCFSGCTGLIDIWWKEGTAVSFARETFYGCTSLYFPSRYNEETGYYEIDNVTFTGLGVFKNAGLKDKVYFPGLACGSSSREYVLGSSGVTEYKLNFTGGTVSAGMFGSNTSGYSSGLKKITGLYGCIYSNTAFNYLGGLEWLEIGSDTLSTKVNINISKCSLNSENSSTMKHLWFGNNVTNICNGAFPNHSKLDYLRWPSEKPTVGSTALTSVGSGAVLRQYFPISNADWKAEIEGDANYTPWDELSGETKALYMNAYPGEPLPAGYCSTANRTALLFKGFVFFYLTSGFNVASTEVEHGTYEPELGAYMDYNEVDKDYTFTATGEEVSDTERWHVRGAEVVNISDGTKNTYEGSSVTVPYLGSPLDFTWIVKHEFNVSVSGEGCTIDSADWYAVGEEVTLTAEPNDPSATLRGWTTNGVEVTDVTLPTLTFTMGDAAMTVVAKFEVLTSEHVTIATNDGQPHGVPGPGNYGLVEQYNDVPIQIGADYTFTNTVFEVDEAIEGHGFACTGYKVINDASQEVIKEGKGNSVTITYEEPCTIEWQWTSVFNFDLTVGENGMVDRESGYLENGSYTLTATPAADYIVDTWKVNGVVQETKDTTLEVTIENAPISVEVSFKYAPVGVSVVTIAAGGALVTNEVTRIEADGEITIQNETPNVVVKENEVRKLCTDWKVVSYRSGETLASGEGASATFNYSAAEPVQLVWQWANQYYITAVVKGTDGETIDPARCAVMGSSGYYSTGDQVSFTVAPLDHFLGWGGVEADKRNDPIVTFTVASAAKKFTAYCLANDKANLIVNGGFEEYGVLGTGTAYPRHYFGDAGSWECEYLGSGYFDGGGYYCQTTPGGQTFSSNLTVHNGDFAGWLGSTKSTTNELRCAVNLPAKGMYSLNFWYRRANNTNGDNLGSNTWNLYVYMEGVGKNKGVKIPLDGTISVANNTDWHEVTLENLSIDRTGPFKLVIAQPGGEIAGSCKYATTGFDDFSFKLVKPRSGMVLVVY